MKDKKLYKNKAEGKLFGVCAGLADYFNVDVVLIRVLWVLAVFGLGTGFLAYFVAALIIPEKPAA
jgi:phage shock protein C